MIYETTVIKTEVIVCPACETVQRAEVTHAEGDPWASFVHSCIKCGYIIMESEWEEVEAPAEGQNWFSHCCKGHDWEIALIQGDLDRDGWSTVYGRCQNPDCPKHGVEMGKNDPYFGVSAISVEDLMSGGSDDLQI